MLDTSHGYYYNCAMYLFLCSDTLAFVTEPVVASLANILGQYDNLPTPLPLAIKVIYTSCTLDLHVGRCTMSCLVLVVHNMLSAFDLLVLLWLNFGVYRFFYLVPVYSGNTEISVCVCVCVCARARVCVCFSLPVCIDIMLYWRRNLNTTVYLCTLGFH